MEHEVPHRIHTEQLHQIVGVDHIAQALGHLVALHQQPGVTEHLLGQLLAHAHKENGPINGVETNDVLADQMQIRRPELLILFVVIAIRVIAAEGDIVAQGIQPHIGHMAGVKFHGNAPGKAGAGNAQILQTGL